VSQGVAVKFGRWLAWIGAVAVVGLAALIYFGIDGTEPEEAPTQVLGTRGSEAADPSSPAEAATRESRPAPARDRERSAASERPDRRADAPAPGGAPSEQGSPEQRAGQEAPDSPESGADQAAIDAFLRAVRAELDAAPWYDQGEPKWGGTTLEGVSVEGRAVVSCASVPTICNLFDIMDPEQVMTVVSNGSEAMLLRRPGEPDIVHIRTSDGVILVRVDNLLTMEQLAALVPVMLSSP
jgi:hypothetical protein